MKQEARLPNKNNLTGKIAGFIALIGLLGWLVKWILIYFFGIEF